MAFEMEGAIAVISIRGPLDRSEIPTLDGYVTLAESNEAVAVLVDVSAVPRVPTSVIGALVRTADRLKESGVLLALIGLDAVRNPVVSPSSLVGRLPVFSDPARARTEVRRRTGAAV